MKYFISITFTLVAIISINVFMGSNTIETIQKKVNPKPSQPSIVLKENSAHKKELTKKKDVYQEKPPSSKPKIHEEKSVAIKTELPKEKIEYSFIQTALFQNMNQERSSPVILHAPLLKSATTRAREAFQKWSHSRPNNKRWDTTLIPLIDITQTLHGENLAKIQIPYKDSYSEEDLANVSHMLHQGLVNSPTHYAVMTNPNYKKVNIGIYTSIQNELLTIVIAQHYTE